MKTTQTTVFDGPDQVSPETTQFAPNGRLYPQAKYKYDDLDDSHHDAEDFHFRESWRHLTRPFGWEWKPDAPDGRLPDKKRALLLPITPDLEPGVGKLPFDVCRHFITKLGLSLDAVEPERFERFGFTKVDELLALRDRAPELTQEEVINKFARILEAERISFTLELIRQEGVIPLDGSSESVFALHKEGIQTVIVTNAPEQIAREVVGKLGYRTYSEMNVTMPDGTEEPRRIVDRNIVPVIISGNKVRNRKPDPEALELADLHMGWYDLRDSNSDVFNNIKTRFTAEKERRINEHGGLNINDKQELLEEFKATVSEATGARGLAMYGDSGSDDGAGSAHGVPRVIRVNGHSSVKKFQARGAVVVPRFDAVTGSMLRGETPFPTIHLNGNLSDHGAVQEPLGPSVELRIQPNQPSLRERT